MDIWILAVLVLFALQTYLPSIMRFTASGLPFGRLMTTALGPRDELPPMPVKGERADRALRNMIESLLVFLPLAVIAHVHTPDSSIALQGAALYFVARALYVPVYVLGVPYIRSVVWGAGVAGIVMIGIAVI